MRLYSMMNDLLNAQDYINLETFMNVYDVSKRTIQNDIAFLVQMSSRKGYQLHMRRGRGYLLEITNKELLQDFIESLYVEQIPDMKDRVKNMLAFLAMQTDFVSMDKIADAVTVSKSSVKKEMQVLDELAKRYHLVVERKSHYGVRLNGRSKCFKDMLVELYFDNNALLLEEIHKDLPNFQDVNNVLVSTFEKEDLNINYNELKNVIVWMEVSAWYAKKSEEKANQDMRKHNASSVERIAWMMKETMEKAYPIQLSEDSLLLIEEVLRKNVRAKVPQVSISDRLIQDIDAFLKEIDEVYQTAFEKDADFKESLVNHVSLLIERLHQKISYKNTLISEICIRYPMIFNIAIRFSDMLKEKYNVEVTHDEAGFIATHFAAHMERERHDKMQRFNRIGVVCSSGGGSAYLIKLQIESLFTHAQVETFNLLQMEELKQFHPQLIFTIMPLEQEFAAPVIYIKELLDDLDLMRIKQMLQYDNCDSLSIDDASDQLYSIFSKDYFKVRKADDYTTLLKEMAMELEEAGIGGDSYCAYVMERESYMSTIYMNGVCIPHPIEIHSNRNQISVCILEDAIQHKEQIVKIVFMIALIKEDYEAHKDITKKLYQLMKDEKRLQRILTSKTFEELLIVMKELDGSK